MSESTYCGDFKDEAEMVLYGTGIHIDDGGIVSKSTKRMAILHEYHHNNFGRRIDLLVHRSDYDSEVEICGIEFKTKDASKSSLKYQQLRIFA